MRRFSTAMPSFLLAYGAVGLRVGSVERFVGEDDFRGLCEFDLGLFVRLRDEFGVFNETAFDAAGAAFMRLFEERRDYLRGGLDGFIRYLPTPARKDLVYTPLAVVDEMMAGLEQENPGCFDDPTATFGDLYAKSGLFIAAVVRRLYNSPVLKAAYADGGERLGHILGHQVYAAAPTAIIDKIVRRFVLGFADGYDERCFWVGERKFKHNLRLFDTMAFVEEGGDLEKKLGEVFAGNSDAVKTLPFYKNLR